MDRKTVEDFKTSCEKIGATFIKGNEDLTCRVGEVQVVLSHGQLRIEIAGQRIGVDSFLKLTEMVEALDLADYIEDARRIKEAQKYKETLERMRSSPVRY
jgi:hypothetical protein